MKVKFLFTAVALMLLIASCTTKQGVINELEDFSYELRDNSRYYDVKDWEKAGNKFIKLRKKVHKYEFDYTPEEKSRIGELEGQCANYMAKGARDGVFDKLKNVASELEGVLKGIFGLTTE